MYLKLGINQFRMSLQIHLCTKYLSSLFVTVKLDLYIAVHFRFMLNGYFVLMCMSDRGNKAHYSDIPVSKKDFR